MLFFKNTKTVGLMGMGAKEKVASKQNGFWELHNQYCHKKDATGNIVITI